MIRFVSTLVSDKNLPKFATATIVASGLVGWIGLKYVESKKNYKSENLNGHPKSSGASTNGEVMSRDEAILHAMIQNAKESDWRENLSNASFAHKRFVLPGQHHHEDDCTEHKQGEEEFVKKIMDRSDKIMDQQREELKKRKLVEEEEKSEIFSSWKSR